MRGKVGRRRRLPLWACFVLDLLLAAALAGGWFLARRAEDALSLRQGEPVVLTDPEPSEATPAPEPAAEAEAVPEPADTPAPAGAAPAPTEDPRSEWQIRFQEHFTPETVRGESSYTSPNLSVTVTQHERGEGDARVTWYVADVYIGSIDCFRSALASTPPWFGHYASIQKMAEESGAVLAVNGDFCGSSYGGVLIRNGVVWSKAPSGVDICLLYRDGSMETMLSEEFDYERALEKEVWQAWSFGPYLLNEDGSPREVPWGSVPADYLIVPHPRTALGYFEPGHYCLVVVDGRRPGWSRGMTFGELAELFRDLGCAAAFNLDGGNSSMMLFNGDLVSTFSGSYQRKLSDILLFTDAPFPAGGDVPDTGGA